MANKNIDKAESAKKCQCQQAGKVVFLTCSGASNCGQIANQVAVSLDILGAGHMYCLAGIGAHNEGMVESARSADRIVVLDGCPTACGKKTAEHAGLVVTDWICVTEEGINKKHNLLLEQEEIEFITQRAKELLSHIPESEK